MKWVNERKFWDNCFWYQLRESTRGMLVGVGPLQSPEN